jgi:hypothetical protein
MVIQTNLNFSGICQKGIILDRKQTAEAVCYFIDFVIFLIQLPNRLPCLRQ